MELRLVFNEDDADENPTLLEYISESFKNKGPFFEYKKLNFFWMSSRTVRPKLR